MKRATLTLLAVVGTGVALGPGPVGAGPANDDTVVTSEPLAGGGYELVVRAAPGQANVLLGHNDTCGGQIFRFCVSDEVGMTDESARCAQVDSGEVACQLQGLRRVFVDTGDMNDTLALQELPDFEVPVFSDATLRAGNDEATVSGRATVSGGRGGDRLRGRRGNQRLLGGRGGDEITGGRGNSDHCDGQAGNDSGGAGCETELSL